MRASVAVLGVVLMAEIVGTSRTLSQPQAGLPSDSNSLAAPGDAIAALGKAGPHAVATLSEDWLDSHRNRTLPVKVYYPKDAKGLCPTIIFSHGLGGSREGYGYLGQHWASHGYISVHLQHPGSDTAVWKGKSDPMGGMRAAAASPDNLINRPRDISFAISRLEELGGGSSTLAGRIDGKRIGAAGHSFGAYTTLAIAGQTFIMPGGAEARLGDRRVKAAVAMSPSASRNKDKLDKVYAGIQIPCLHMTGTKDDSPIGNTPAHERRMAFDHIAAPHQYLVTFADGDHAIFSDAARFVRGRDKDKRFHELILAMTTAFWEAYLCDRPEPRKWLAGEGLALLAGKDAVVEKKLPREP